MRSYFDDSSDRLAAEGPDHRAVALEGNLAVEIDQFFGRRAADEAGLLDGLEDLREDVEASQALVIEGGVPGQPRGGAGPITGGAGQGETSTPHHHRVTNSATSRSPMMDPDSWVRRHPTPPWSTTLPE